MTRVKFIKIMRGILLAFLITMTPSLGIDRATGSRAGCHKHIYCE